VFCILVEQGGGILNTAVFYTPSTHNQYYLYIYVYSLYVIKLNLCQGTEFEQFWLSPFYMHPLFLTVTFINFISLQTPVYEDVLKLHNFAYNVNTSTNTRWFKYDQD